jgi:plasmid stability protein
MADLLVRNIEEPLVRKLHERAKANGRSAAEEHRQILREALLGGNVRENFQDLAARIRAMTPPDVPQTPAEELIRKGREER